VLRGFLQMLGCRPTELLHTGSFEKLGRKLEDYSTSEALIGLLLEHPEVMNRPICVRGDRAVIARPSEKVNEILDR
jgi:arsenate reductase